ncbi:MAG: methylmalonyl-CoA mutase, partial [Chloroflexota bacterium]|nr:methylmalonyl-CoA mutase [Chloroflexota bacterium]
QQGGAVKAIEQGFQQREILQAAYEYQRQIESGDRQLVGVNAYVMEEDHRPEIMRVDRALADRQVGRLRQLRQDRNNGAVRRALDGLGRAAAGTDNLMAPIIEAVRSYATTGEICDVLRKEFGEYSPPSVI